MSKFKKDLPEKCPIKEAFDQNKPELYILLSPFFCDSKTCHKCDRK